MRAAPKMVLRSLPHVSVRRALVIEANNSKAPSPKATAAIPASETPKSSSSHDPNVTNMHWLAAIRKNIDRITQ